MSLHKWCQALLFLTLLLTVTAVEVSAQIISTPVHAGFGGGGTAYSSGYESMFLNPANLHLGGKGYRMEWVAGAAGIQMVSAASSVNTRPPNPDWFLQQTEIFQPEDALPIGNRAEFIDRNYPSQRLISAYHTVGEVHWIGFHRPGVDRSFSISFRSRFAGRYEVGRHYYDDLPLQKSSESIFNRSLRQQFQSLHELAFGFAETFTFLNDRFPQSGRLAIGITPKLIASGSYLDAHYLEEGVQPSGSGAYDINRRFRYRSTGSFSNSINQMFHNTELQNSAWVPATQEELFKISGFGGGFDIGVTYMIPFGEARHDAGLAGSRHPQSLRFSLSITDIGFIAYKENPWRIRSEESDTKGEDPDVRSDIIFTGRPGEFTYFLDNSDIFPLIESAETDTDAYTTLLPAAIHTGTQIQLNWITLIGDLSLGLTESAFHSARVTTYLGTEIRLISHIPIRAGTRIEPSLPLLYSFGTGFETRTFAINLALQVRKLSDELTGISMAALRFYIP